MFTDYRCPISAIDCRHRKQASDDFSIVGDYRRITSIKYGLIIGTCMKKGQTIYSSMKVCRYRLIVNEEKRT
jgi:hypothetical protein